ncbi:MAG TPA: hypothetical protein ENJ09_10455 [Planctomycetes bacterium]|nr:hypothetical protein [Planctomycetota bacterium]
MAAPRVGGLPRAPGRPGLAGRPVLSRPRRRGDGPRVPQPGRLNRIRAQSRRSDARPKTPQRINARIAQTPSRGRIFLPAA